MEPLSHDQAQAQNALPQSEAAPAARSGYGIRPGSEFPAVVYVSVLAGFAWMLLASWLMFGSTREIDLDLWIATVLFIAMLGLPVLIARMASSNGAMPHTPRDEFMQSRVETATGSLTAGQAWLQVLLIPLVVALAATLIGLANVVYG